MISNYTTDLWNGNIKLYIIFWFYYIFIRLILFILFDIGDTITNLNFLISIKLFIYYIYSIFIIKSLYSASTKVN